MHVVSGKGLANKCVFLVVAFKVKYQMFEPPTPFPTFRLYMEPSTHLGSQFCLQQTIYIMQSVLWL